MTTQTAYLPRRRFTVHEYHRMAVAGVLDKDDRAELIDGEVVEMAPIGRRDISSVDRSANLLFGLFREVAIERVQSPLRLDEYTEPQPADIFLVIEVGDATANLDSRVKAPLYARYGIPELLLADLEQDTLTLYRDPSPRHGGSPSETDGYRTVQTLRRGDRFALLAFPEREIAVVELLGAG